MVEAGGDRGKAQWVHSAVIELIREDTLDRIDLPIIC